MPTLYLVATPIGNLEDITLRALRILQEVTLIAAEDTRTTGRLLAHYDISTPQTSYHEHNERGKLERVLTALQSGDVALVSDAGTPGLSDPGYQLIREAIARGVEVVPLPGASAVVAALVASGLPTDSFVYLGFLPRKQAGRQRVLAEQSAQHRTLVAFEAPHRLLDALNDVLAVLGDRPLAVARELTKLHEEVFRGKASHALAYFEANAPRGEITLVIGGADTIETPIWDEAAVRVALQQALAQGQSMKQASRSVAKQAGWSARAVYNLGAHDAT